MEMKMQLAVADNTPTWMPYKYREAQSEVDELVKDLAGSEGDSRLPLIEHHAASVFGYAYRGLLDKQEAADILHFASAQCGATQDYGADRVQAALAAGELEA